MLSHVLPPSPSGQSVMLFRVLEGIEPGDYVLVTCAPAAPERGSEGGSALPARLYRVSPASQKSFRWARVVPRLPGLLVAANNVLRRALEIARILRREGCRAIVACTGELYDLPAAYLASRLAGTEFHAYLFDDYVHQWTHPSSRRLAERFAPLLLRRARSVIVPNEFLRDDYRRRYGVSPVIVRNPIGRAMEAFSAPPPSPAFGERRIVYTGAVYHAHFDAFRNLMAAIGMAGDPMLRLHVYTANTREELRAGGVEGPIELHPHQPPASMEAIQAAATMLFLPLAFHSQVPELIRTSAPGKMGEYLASGRPILVHAPADSFVAWYFRTHECGLVVDELSPERMAGAIRRLTGDAAFAEKLGRNARERARVDFDPSAASAAFAGAVDGAPGVAA